MTSKNAQPGVKTSTRRPQRFRKELNSVLRRNRHETVEYIEMVDCWTQTTPRNKAYALVTPIDTKSKVGKVNRHE